MTHPDSHIPLHLFAYRHTAEKTGRVHLRVRQNVYGGDDVKERLYHVGSPAYWKQDALEWDYPLSPAAVIELDKAAKDVGATLEWDPQDPEIQQMADYNLQLEQYEERVRLGIEKAIREKQELPGYPTNTVSNTKPPMHHQAVSYHWALRTSGLLLAHEPGCIAGSEVVKINRHGKVYGVPLKELYLKFHGLPVSHPWKKPEAVTVKSLFPDGILRHNRIVNVLYQGKKEVYQITLESGKTLRCTGDHEISCPGGKWHPAFFLQAGDEVLTNGTPACLECGSTDKTIVGGGKNKGLCYSCIHRGVRNGRWISGKQTDKDGYILISNQYSHPYRDRHNCVREHVLVMEEHLGRHVLPEEVVHHRDENKKNNNLDNLELMTSVEHASLHGRESKFSHMNGGTAGTGGEIVFIPKKDRVVSVVRDGTEDVYDLVMEDPARNFVVNGIIVHNCGKTRSGLDAAGGWYREQVIRPMRQIWRPTAKIGKTIGCWGVEGGILVVAPKVMLRTWASEAFTWQGMVAVEISGSRKKKIQYAGTLAHLHVVNYEMLGLLIDMGNRYDAIIVDESHKCANASNQTFNVQALSLNCRRRLLLTGTPVTNDLRSVFFQMLICDGGRALGPSINRFLSRYFNSERGHNGQLNYTPRQGAVEEVSAAMSKNTYFLKKEDVLDLPQKTHTPILLDMTAEQARYYEQIRTETISYIQDSEVTTDMAATRMMKLAQICQGFVLADDGNARRFTNIKQESLTALLLDTYRHRKVVVWARFTYEIEVVCNMLHEAGVSFVRMDGRVKKSQKDTIINAWQTRPDIKVFVGQLQMGIGITLHAAECEIPCCDTIYLGLDYSFINWKQTQDRIHRIGQNNACNYQYLLTENGIDHKMYRALLSKEETAEAVHKQGKDFYLSLLRDDVPSLAAID